MADDTQKQGLGSGPHVWWLPLEKLVHCPEKVAEYDAAAPRRSAARRADPDAATAPVPAAQPTAPPPLVAPAGFRLAAPSEVVTGLALVGRPMLVYWPTDGWVRGRWPGVVVSRATRISSGTMGGRRWTLLWLIRSAMPFARPGGAVGAALPCAPAPAPHFSRPTVTASQLGPAWLW